MLPCEICEIFKNTFFIQHLQTTAFDTKQTFTVATTEFLAKFLTERKYLTQTLIFVRQK